MQASLGFRTFALCLTCFSAQAGISQDLSAPVDLTTAAVPVRVAIQKLSGLSGIKLTAEGDVANEPIILRLTQTPVSEAMKRIADVVHGEWKPIQGGFDLSRSGELVAVLERESTARRAKEISTAISKKLQALDALGPWNSEKALKLAKDLVAVNSIDEDAPGALRTRMGLWPRMPDYAAFWKILKAFDPRELASVKPGERVAFSNLPAKIQRQAPINVLESVPDWAEQHNELADDVKKLSGVTPQSSYGNEGIPEVPFAGKITRVTVTVIRPGPGADLNVNLLAFDEQNRPLGFITESVDATSGEDWNALRAQWKAQKQSVETPISFSPPAMQLVKFNFRTPKPMIDPVRSLLLHPEEHDPLSLVVSEALIQIANDEHKNLVASPDDDLFPTASQLEMMAGPGAPFTKSFLWGLGPISETAFAEDDGWITVTPVDPLSATDARSDRVAVGKFLRAIDERGFCSIEDAAEVVSSMEGEVAPPVLSTLSSMLFKNVRAPSDETIDLLRLYSALGPDLVKRALSGQAIRVGELDATQTDALNQIVYEHEAPNTPQVENGPALTIAEVYASREPTEAFSAGLPANGTISMNEQDSDGYLVHFEARGWSNAQNLTLSDVASMIAQASSPGATSNMPIPKTLQASKHRVLTFDINLGRNQTRSGMLEETVSTGEEYVVDKLPPDLQSRLDKLVAGYLRAQKSDPDSQPPAKPPSRDRS